MVEPQIGMTNILELKMLFQIAYDALSQQIWWPLWNFLLFISFVKISFLTKLTFIQQNVSKKSKIQILNKFMEWEEKET